MHSIFSLRKVAIYQLYPDQESAVAAAVQSKARGKSELVVAIDTHFYPPCLYDKVRPYKQQIKFYLEYIWSYLKWYFAHFKKGTLVIPLAFFCNIVDILPFLHGFPQLKYSRLADYYRFTRTTFSSELFATYFNICFSKSKS